MHIIFLDFEGLQASKNSAPHDCKMFALSVLLSSMVCFNSKVSFEEKTLDEMSMISDLHRFIKIRAPINVATSMNAFGSTPGENEEGGKKGAHRRHRSSKIKDRKSVVDGTGGESTATNKQMISQICPKLLWLIRDSKIYF